MNNNDNSRLIQEWFVINDDLWSHILVTIPVREPEQTDAGSFADAA